MGNKLSLTSEEILNHVFKSSSKGYDPLEVDKFLDVVLSDYKSMEAKKINDQKQLEKIKNDNDVLIKKVRELEFELATYKVKFSNLKPSDNINLDNINYIKRINDLETFLFKNGFDPSKIK